MISPDHDLQRALGWFATKRETMGMRVSTSNLRPWFSAGFSLFRSGWSLCRRFFMVLFMSDGKKEQETDRQISAASAVKWALYWTSVIKRELRQQSKAGDIPLNLGPNSHLWSRASGSGRKNEIADTSRRNEFPPQGGWAQPQRLDEQLRHEEGGQSRGFSAAFSRWKKTVEWGLSQFWLSGYPFWVSGHNTQTSNSMNL